MQRRIDRKRATEQDQRPGNRGGQPVERKQLHRRRQGQQDHHQHRPPDPQGAYRPPDRACADSEQVGRSALNHTVAYDPHRHKRANGSEGPTLRVEKQRYTNDEPDIARAEQEYPRQ